MANAGLALAVVALPATPTPTSGMALRWLQRRLPSAGRNNRPTSSCFWLQVASIGCSSPLILCLRQSQAFSSWNAKVSMSKGHRTLFPHPTPAGWERIQHRARAGVSSGRAIPIQNGAQEPLEQIGQLIIHPAPDLLGGLPLALNPGSQGLQLGRLGPSLSVPGNEDRSSNHCLML